MKAVTDLVLDPAQHLSLVKDKAVLGLFDLFPDMNPRGLLKAPDTGHRILPVVMFTSNVWTHLLADLGSPALLTCPLNRPAPRVDLAAARRSD